MFLRINYDKNSHFNNYSKQLFYQSIKLASFLLFSCSIYKIVVREYSLDNYKTLKISIGAIMEDPEILKFVPDHPNTKKMGKNVAVCNKICSCLF